jgi:Tfp pilus assembly protein PilF
MMYLHRARPFLTIYRPRRFAVHDGHPLAKRDPAGPGVVATILFLCLFAAQSGQLALTPVLADAAREFERAAALDPNNAAYWTNLGNAQRGAGDARGAEKAYRRAIDVDANAADAANGLGVLLVEAQKPAEAAAWFEGALTAAPDLVEARLNLGIARQQSGDTARAADAYRAVLAARGDHPREKQAAAKLLAAIGAAR